MDRPLPLLSLDSMRAFTALAEEKPLRLELMAIEPERREPSGMEEALAGAVEELNRAFAGSTRRRERSGVGHPGTLPADDGR